MIGIDDFDAFVHTRYTELLRFGRALTGSADAGADLLHDALASTLRAWDRVQSHGDPEGYVRRTMVNRNISLWRRRVLERDNRPTPSEPTPERDPDIWDAVRGLPARQRTVIALRYYLDLPVAEVAAVMGCTTGTVKSQTSKALAHLDAALGETHREVADGR